MSVTRHHASSAWSSAPFAAALLLLLVAAPSTAQMNIASLTISSGPAYNSGVFTDFFLEPELTGSGIASVLLSRESGGSISLIEDSPGVWICNPGVVGNCDFFPTLQDLRDLGDLTFTVTGTLGESDSILIPFEDWDPNSSLPVPGFPEISSPTPGQTGVSLTPTFTWNTPPAWVDVIFAEAVVAATGDDVDSAQLLETATSWAPILVQEGVPHEFNLSFFAVFFFEESRLSPNSDSYLFTSGYQAFNFVTFATAGTALPVLHGIGAAVLVLGLIGASIAALRRGPGKSAAS